MRKILFAFPFLLSSVLLAQTPSINREQAQMRDRIREVQNIYSSLEKQLSSSFQNERSYNDSVNVKEEFEIASHSIRSVEKDIVIPFLPGSGKSRIWEKYKRVADYEPRHEGGNALSGPEQDVILYNGEFIQATTDLSLPTRGGIGFSINRYYHSQTDYSGCMGDGWDFNYNAHLIFENADPNESSHTTLFLNGKSYTFTRKDSEWQSGAANFYHLKYESGQFYVYDFQKKRMEFEKSAELPNGWRLKSIASRHDHYSANQISISYQNNSDRIAYIIDPYNNRATIGYDNEGRISHISTFGNAVYYKYSSIGLLEEVCWADSAINLKDVLRKKVKYTYDAISGRNLLVSRNENDSLASYSVVYDSAGRVIGVGPKSHDKNAMWFFERNNHIVTVSPAQPAAMMDYIFESPSCSDLPSEIKTSALNSIEKYTYNSDGMIIEHLDSIGVKRVFEYDSNNPLPELHSNLLKETIYPSTNQESLKNKKIVTETVYLPGTTFPTKITSYEDNEENVLSTKEYEYSNDDYEVIRFRDNGILTQYLYNRYGENVVILDANNNATIKYYSSSWPTGNNYEFVEGAVDQGGLLVSIVADVSKSVLDKVCTTLGAKKYQYNDLLHLNAASLKTQYAYNNQGLLLRSKTGTKESFALYNRNGDALVTWETQVGYTLMALSNQFLPQDIYHQFVPAESQPFKGHVSPFFKGVFYKESLTYDSMGLVSSIIKTDELIQDCPVVYLYDRYPNGQLHTITDPMGITRVDEYGTNGLLRRQYVQNENEFFIFNNDFEYFPNGIIQKYKNTYGEDVINDLDIYGRLTSTTDVFGVKSTTQFDGIGRVVEDRAEKNDRLLSKKTYEYGNNGLLATVYEYRISETINEVILSQEMKYDANGNIIASRGTHDNSWEHILYDGLNRAVVHKYPSNDYMIVIYRDEQIAMTQKMLFEDNDKYRAEGVFLILDKAGNPVVSVPTDIDCKPQLNRTVVSEYAVSGELLSTKRPGLTENLSQYNTLGQLVVERTVPLSKDKGEKELITKYSYLPNGKVIEKSVSNIVLAITGSKTDAKPFLVHAPQAIVYSYDKLGRELSIRQPDGLIVEKKYNTCSLPAEMIWKHITDEQNELRHLNLHYDRNGRLKSISDANDTCLRSYQYDDYGNRIVETDGNVTVRRQFDSLGLLLSEQTFVGQRALPGFTKSYTLQNGEETLTWKDIQRFSKGNWNTLTTIHDASNRVASIVLDQASSSFATWKYIGSQERERYIPESRITQRNSFGNCNELIESVFYDNSKRFGQLSYQYDVIGNVIYSSANLDDSTYTCAQYMDYNSFQQIVAQNSETNLPTRGSILDRRNQVFGTLSPQSQKTLRMVYDQTNNIWANYHGNVVQNPVPDSFSKESLLSFVSPSKLLSSTDLSSNDLLELSSNRETTRAFYSETATLSAEENEYDKLGNLVKFSGEFWNNNRTLNVVWHLSFDDLGRLVYMRGVLKDDVPSLNLQQGSLTAELNFLYDANNRRIRKEVRDYSHTNETLVSKEWTIYINNSQTLVLKDEGTSLSLVGQYLWKPDSRELLMATLPQKVAENIGTFTNQRYFFQQDRGFNTVCVTKTENGIVSLVSAASYMCFGNNTTSAKIKSIESSMTSSNAALAMNNSLEDFNAPASWQKLSNLPQFITIHLAEKANLTSLSIWTDSSFPQDFYAFVLPQNIDSPRISEDLMLWRAQMAQEGYLVKHYHSMEPSTIYKPITIPLLSMSGNKIVLTWDSDGQNGAVFNSRWIHVNEFEVGRNPDNPGAIAFAGQWLDRETNLYYQINRYRLAGSNKFISPDPIGYLDGDNLYAYAKNNPLSWHDPNGEYAQYVVALFGAGIGAIVGGGMYAINCWLTGEEFSWAEFGISALAGAATGALLCSGIKIPAPALGALAFGVGGAIEEGGISYHRTGDVCTAGKDALMGAASGAVLGGIGGMGKAGLLKTSGRYALAGGAIGGIRNGIENYSETGDLMSSSQSALKGAVVGSLGGAIAGAGAYAISSATQHVSNKIASLTTSQKNPVNTYSRPSGYRKGVRDAVWEMAIEPSTGRVRDPLTGRFMSKNAPWDMGHKPGYEWWKFKKHAEAWGLSREQVLDWNNNPNHFRPELPSSNRSHLAEDLTSAFFGL